MNARTVALRYYLLRETADVTDARFQSEFIITAVARSDEQGNLFKERKREMCKLFHCQWRKRRYIFNAAIEPIVVQFSLPNDRPMGTFENANSRK